MKKLVILLLTVAFSIYGSAQGLSRTIHVPVAGTLSDYISDEEKYQIDDLTLTGELNSSDFRLLRDMAGNNYLGVLTDGRLATLNLYEAKIVTGGENYLDTDDGIYFAPSQKRSGYYHLRIENSDEFSQYLFAGCLKLQHITLPKDVHSMNNGVFYHCSSLASVILPEGLRSLDGFMDCENLHEVTIPSTVEVIKRYAFAYCI